MKDKTNKRKLEDIDEEINILKNEIKTNKRKLIKLEKQIVTSDEKHESNVDMLFEKTSNYEDKFNNLHNDIKILNEKLDSHRKLESKKELDCNNNQSISKRLIEIQKANLIKGLSFLKRKLGSIARILMMKRLIIQQTIVILAIVMIVKLVQVAMKVVVVV